MKSEESFEVGDLVVFKSTSPTVMRNQVGIIIQTGVKTIYQKEYFIQEEWFVAQFGNVRLIVSVDMIAKIEDLDLTKDKE